MERYLTIKQNSQLTLKVGYMILFFFSYKCYVIYKLKSVISRLKLALNNIIPYNTIAYPLVLY